MFWNHSGKISKCEVFCFYFILRPCYFFSLNYIYIFFFFSVDVKDERKKDEEDLSQTFPDLEQRLQV